MKDDEPVTPFEAFDKAVADFYELAIKKPILKLAERIDGVLRRFPRLYAWLSR